MSGSKSGCPRTFLSKISTRTGCRNRIFARRSASRVPSGCYGFGWNRYMRPLRILFSCSGVGIIDRGIEIFLRDAFDRLRSSEGLDITLYKGAGEEKSNEHVLWNVPRTGCVAQFLGRIVRRSSYTVEQLSTFPSMVQAIRKHRPDIIFYGDSNLGFQLFRWRKQIGVPVWLWF